MLRGNLADFPLVGILQLLFKDQKTGTIRVKNAQGGAVGVRDGGVVEAIYSSVRGDRALSLLNSLVDAPFEFDGSIVPNQVSVSTPTAQLLIGLHREHERWQRLRERLKDWSVAPQWLMHPDKFRSAEQAVMASLIDGKRTIETVLIEGQLAPLRSAELLVEMSDLRMIALSPLSQLTEPQRLVVLSVYSPDQSTVFVNRDLHRVWAQTFGQVRAVIVSPKGDRASFSVQPRDNISERTVMIPDGALRKLKLARGVTVTVLPQAHP
jgi:Domain of unknown function (DUF4388)